MASRREMPTTSVARSLVEAFLGCCSTLAPDLREAVKPGCPRGLVRCAPRGTSPQRGDDWGAGRAPRRRRAARRWCDQGGTHGCADWAPGGQVARVVRAAALPGAGQHAAIASRSPWWQSEVTSCTPDRPRAARPRRNASHPRRPRRWRRPGRGSPLAVGVDAGRDQACTFTSAALADLLVSASIHTKRGSVQRPGPEAATISSSSQPSR